VTTSPAPLYIPSEICSAVDAAPLTPPDQCLTLVQQQVNTQNVSAPPPVVPALLAVVDQARVDGIDLKIVVLDRNPLNDPPLRDVATVVGAQHPDATVLVLSPSYVGTYSTHFPRSTLEIGEDDAKTGNPVVSAQNFLQQLNTPQLPWTALTIVLLAGVLAAAVGARVMQLCGRRAATSDMDREVSTADTQQSV
jgi:hypothetical protein